MSEKTSPVARELPGGGAWLADNGAYVDIAQQYGYYDQDISALDNTRRNGYKASFDTHSIGVSIEAGHKLPSRAASLSSRSCSLPGSR